MKKEIKQHSQIIIKVSAYNCGKENLLIGMQSCWLTSKHLLFLALSCGTNLKVGVSNERYNLISKMDIVDDVAKYFTTDVDSTKIVE